jgi:hypothetical protein
MRADPVERLGLVPRQQVQRLNQQRFDPLDLGSLKSVPVLAPILAPNSFGAICTMAKLVLQNGVTAARGRCQAT